MKTCEKRLKVESEWECRIAARRFTEKGFDNFVPPAEGHPGWVDKPGGCFCTTDEKFQECSKTFFNKVLEPDAAITEGAGICRRKGIFSYHSRFQNYYLNCIITRK